MSDELPSPSEGHAFVEPEEGQPADRCALCGESRVQIRHHPTRIRAAALLRERAEGGAEPR